MATNTGVDVAITSTEVLAAQTKRKYCVIVNDSDTVIYLAIGAAAALNSGIRLNANGGVFELGPTDGETSAIYGIHGATGTKRVTVVSEVFYI